MFIDKWWGNYIGSSDDSFLLLDYFGTRKTSDFELCTILEDTGLASLLKNGGLENGDLSFKIDEGYVPHFDIAVDVLTDLSAIVLECLQSGKVAIKDLDSSSKYSQTITIDCRKEDIKLLADGLDKFISNPANFELADMMDEDSLGELVNDCREVYVSLIAFQH
ncbi:hypothetical protein D0T84_06800 [Dysgonomonas sp. 521]|uniref:imm68 putative immunity domain-containing protein n=1 Tax=Dysgonomonas sp. 521 TaxID=2302932 RepID=UPI0013D6FA84|nr:imm68 putative immunity domain-containing protein [Dysgonomonas sp. 521]NDV94630.1 hypothetical protein [Dysgonomonas sp. 521]